MVTLRVQANGQEVRTEVGVPNAETAKKIFTPLRVGWPPTPQVYFGP